MPSPLRPELVASVGIGSLLLAAAGLPADKQATTHWAYRRVLEHLGATSVRGCWVQDGKSVTAADTPGGIDLALTLVARQKDERTARRVRLWIEYDPPSPFGRPKYDDTGFYLGSGRAPATLGAPLLTAGPKRLTARGL